MYKLEKNSLKKIIKSIRPIHYLALAIISLVISLFALRANNEHMLTLRNAVYNADQQNGNVTLALQNLQSYVTHNMNTNLNSGNGSVYPPIQLKYTYQRLLASESNAVAASNTSLYTQAEYYCQAQIPTGFSGRYRVPCIEQYIESHDTTLPSIPTSLYEFDFISPTWSPDLAGLSLLLSLVSFIAFILSIVIEQLYRLLVPR
jgi:hypothetical protein